jgi:hypothetical protein
MRAARSIRRCGRDNRIHQIHEASIRGGLDLSLRDTQHEPASEGETGYNPESCQQSEAKRKRAYGHSSGRA